MTDLTKLTAAQALGLTGAGEARAELVPGKGWLAAPLDDMVAVMWTPVHRLALGRYGSGIADVCFEAVQYSCWNPRSGSNHDWVVSQAAIVLGGPGTVSGVVVECIAAAGRILAGVDDDTVDGATHYYSPLSMVPPGRVPAWARGLAPCAHVGGHLFFKGVR